MDNIVLSPNVYGYKSAIGLQDKMVIFSQTKFCFCFALFKFKIVANRGFHQSNFDLREKIYFLKFFFIFLGTRRRISKNDFPEWTLK